MAVVVKVEARNDQLEMQIRDFGPIGSAVIRPRPLTVFIGPSGSGKSFAATALYAFARTGQELATAMEGGSRLVGYPEHVAKMIDDIGNKHSSLLGHLPPVTQFDPDTAEFQQWIVHALHATGNHLSAAVGSAIDQLLGAKNFREMNRFGAEGDWAAVVGVPGNVKLEGKHGRAVVPAHLFQPGSGEHYFDIPGTKELARRMLWAVGESVQDEHVGKFLAAALVTQSAKLFQSRFGPAPLLMPAGRTGMSATGPFADRLMAFGATHHVEMAGHNADFLDQFKIAGTANKPGDFSDVIEGIERSLHQGRIEQRAGTTMFPILDLVVGEHRIPMERASSSVSELAPVTFILRRLARKGMMVVLEEPEAHLHPAKQILLADALASLVHEGLRLVVTTHSEFLVDALGWIVRATETGSPTRPELPAAERLAKDDIAVYRFHEPKPGAGFTATPIEFDPEEGFDRANWVDEAGKLFNRHADVSRRQRQRAEKRKR